MQLVSQSLKARNTTFARAMSAARSARYRDTMDRNALAKIDAERDRRHRRKVNQNDRELERLLAPKARIRVPEQHRPKLDGRTALKLYQRTKGILEGSVGGSIARGPDGKYAIHFGFVARGLKSTKGRFWRRGEAARAARYVVREDALEGDEQGWWSNIAEDRTELTAFFRIVEDIERHDRANANVYCTEIISLPYEMTTDQRRETVEEICGFFRERGLPFVAAIHNPDPGGDQRNFHCHLVYSLRPCARVAPFEWEVALEKRGDINNPSGILARRNLAVATINRKLADYGIDKQYTPLSNAARGMPKPAPKVGQHGTWAARRLQAAKARRDQLRRLGDMVGKIRDQLVDHAERLTKVAAAETSSLEAASRNVRDGSQFEKRIGAARCQAQRWLDERQRMLADLDARADRLKSAASEADKIRARDDAAKLAAKKQDTTTPATPSIVAGTAPSALPSSAPDKDSKGLRVNRAKPVTPETPHEKSRIEEAKPGAVPEAFDPYAEWRAARRRRLNEAARAKGPGTNPMQISRRKGVEDADIRAERKRATRLDLERRKAIHADLFKSATTKLRKSERPFGDATDPNAPPRAGILTPDELYVFLEWQQTKRGAEFVRTLIPQEDAEPTPVEVPTPAKAASPAISLADEEEFERLKQLQAQLDAQKKRGR